MPINKRVLEIDGSIYLEDLFNIVLTATASEFNSVAARLLVIGIYFIAIKNNKPAYMHLK